jgi:hypothetical protein
LKTPETVAETVAEKQIVKEAYPQGAYTQTVI